MKIFKNLCNKKITLVFVIKTLTKKTLTLQFDETLSDKNNKINQQIITFDRIAGPAENME